MADSKLSNSVKIGSPCMKELDIIKKIESSTDVDIFHTPFIRTRLHEAKPNLFFILLLKVIMYWQHTVAKLN